MSSTQIGLVVRYTAYDHHGQWFVKGPDDYLLRAGYGFKGKQLAGLAVYAWDSLRHVKADDVTDQLPTMNIYRSHYDTDNGTWSVHGPEGTRMPTGSGKRGEYHAKMLSFVGNGYRKQAHWYHNAVYPRAVYVLRNTVLLDVSPLDYPGNPLIAALADPANPEHGAAHQHMYRQCSAFLDELFTDGTMDKIKSAIDMCVKRAERFATVREAAIAFEDDPVSAGRDLVGRVYLKTSAGGDLYTPLVSPIMGKIRYNVIATNAAGSTSTDLPLSGIPSLRNAGRIRYD